MRIRIRICICIHPGPWGASSHEPRADDVKCRLHTAHGTGTGTSTRTDTESRYFKHPYGINTPRLCSARVLDATTDCRPRSYARAPRTERCDGVRDAIASYRRAVDHCVIRYLVAQKQSTEYQYRQIHPQRSRPTLGIKDVAAELQGSGKANTNSRILPMFWLASRNLFSFHVSADSRLPSFLV